MKFSHFFAQSFYTKFHLNDDFIINLFSRLNLIFILKQLKCNFGFFKRRIKSN